ncbi:MAG: hypothetical protein IPP79_21220 [Chitinophagaceae bacterium]|nr:hypothetical protein [Chitinophagaceae bacterium]
MKESESITYSYERNAEDPRVAHSLNLKLDEYGNVLESASVVYPRLTTDASLPIETQLAQNKTVIIFTQNQFTNDVLADFAYRLRLPSETKTFELKGVVKSNTYYTPIDFEDILSDIKSDTVLYHETDKNLISGKAQKGCLSKPDPFTIVIITNPLGLHQLESLALFSKVIS